MSDNLIYTTACIRKVSSNLMTIVGIEKITYGNMSG